MVTALDFDAAVLRTRVALRANGFGIISEMPAPAAVGEHGRRHLFLGVWETMVAAANLGGPGLDLGDHLHCHVVVFEDEGSVVVAALDPTEGLQGAPDVAAGMRRALDGVFSEVVSPE